METDSIPVVEVLRIHDTWSKTNISFLDYSMEQSVLTLRAGMRRKLNARSRKRGENMFWARIWLSQRKLRESAIIRTLCRTSPTRHFLIDCFHFDIMGKEIWLVIWMEVWRAASSYHAGYADISCPILDQLHIQKWNINIPQTWRTHHLPCRMKGLSMV